MWDIFKEIPFIKRKIELKEKQIADEIKRINHIKSELKIVEHRANGITTKAREDMREDEKKKNSICPSCQGENVNNRIKRQQGEMSGSMSGSGHSSLFHGSSSMSGHVSGKLDTNPVNKCNDCDHEWKIYNGSYSNSYTNMKFIANGLVYELEKYHDALNCTFDPLDANEKYNSIEEKKEALIKKSLPDWRLMTTKQLWDGISFDTFTEYVKKNVNEFRIIKYDKYYSEEFLSNFGLVKLNFNKQLELPKK